MPSLLIDRPPGSPPDVRPREWIPPFSERLSRRGWARVRLAITASVFVVATVLGVALGETGPTVSPVSPPAVVAADPAAGAAVGNGTVPAGQGGRVGRGNGGGPRDTGRPTNPVGGNR